MFRMYKDLNPADQERKSQILGQRNSSKIALQLQKSVHENLSDANGVWYGSGSVSWQPECVRAVGVCHYSGIVS